MKMVRLQAKALVLGLHHTLLIIISRSASTTKLIMEEFSVVPLFKFVE
jgi:hypothetical protein